MSPPPRLECRPRHAAARLPRIEAYGIFWTELPKTRLRWRSSGWRPPAELSGQAVAPLARSSIPAENWNGRVPIDRSPSRSRTDVQPEASDQGLRVGGSRNGTLPLRTPHAILSMPTRSAEPSGPVGARFSSARARTATLAGLRRYASISRESRSPEQMGFTSGSATLQVPARRREEP